mgnify:CR=1 FL=1
MYISFLVFAVAFIASLVCFVMSFKYRKAIVVLLAVGLAVSVFMTAELGLHIASPDISRVTKEAAEYAKTLPGPYFIFRDYGMQYYLGKDAVKLDFGTDPDSLKLSNSTLVVVDFPMLGKESKLWKRFMQCEQKKAFSSKGLILGYVFAC